MAAGRDGEWLRPEIVTDAGPPRAAQGPAMFELRPLSLGEVLDRTFALYRSRFRLFAGISMVSASVHVAVQAVSLATAHMLLRSAIGVTPAAPPGPMAVRTLLASEVRVWIAGLVFFLVSAVTQAATSLAMSEVYLNQETSAKAALLVAAKRWYRWVGIAIWQAWSLTWIFLAASVPALLLMGYGGRGRNATLMVLGGVLMFAAVFGGLPVGVVLYLRNALAVPAAVVERLKIRAAMRRSKALSVGTKGRTFVVLLIATVLYGVVSALESPAALLMMIAPHQEHYLAQAITLVISFLGYTVVAPVALIGLTLLYFDQRVRKEALDLQLLLEQTRGPAPQTLAYTPTEASAGERIASVE